MTISDIGVKHILLSFAKMVDENVIKLNSDLAQVLVKAYKYGLKNSMTITGSWFIPFRRLIEGANDGFCGGLGHELDLRPDKKIYTCAGASEPIADLDSIDQIPNNPAYLKVTTRIPSNIQACKGCDIEGLCAGQCACDAENATNNFLGINNKVCDFEKELLQLLLEDTIS